MAERDTNEIFPREGLLQFSMILKTACEQAGESHRKFARRAGISQGTVSLWISNLERGEKERLSSLSTSNIITVAKHLRNPETGEAFTAERIFGICTAEKPFPDDLIKTGSFVIEPQLSEQKQDSPSVPGHYAQIAQLYWQDTIEPSVNKYLEDCGERNPQDGSLTITSRDYVFAKSPTGKVSINPKDGRPSLTPGNITQKDWTVLNKIVDNVQASQQKKASLSTRQESRKPKVSL
jgi:transcriptional regulator with XRE-family HTH domain